MAYPVDHFSNSLDGPALSAAACASTAAKLATNVTQPTLIQGYCRILAHQINGTSKPKRGKWSAAVCFNIETGKAGP